MHIGEGGVAIPHISKLRHANTKQESFVVFSKELISHSVHCNMISSTRRPIARLGHATVAPAANPRTTHGNRARTHESARGRGSAVGARALARLAHTKQTVPTSADSPPVVVLMTMAMAMVRPYMYGTRCLAWCANVAEK